LRAAEEIGEFTDRLWLRGRDGQMEAAEKIGKFTDRLWLRVGEGQMGGSRGDSLVHGPVVAARMGRSDEGQRSTLAISWTGCGCEEGTARREGAAEEIGEFTDRLWLRGGDDQMRGSGVNWRFHGPVVAASWGRPDERGAADWIGKFTDRLWLRGGDRHMGGG
jgi:hypothetical protein